MSLSKISKDCMNLVDAETRREQFFFLNECQTKDKMLDVYFPHFCCSEWNHFKDWPCGVILLREQSARLDLVHSLWSPQITRFILKWGFTFELKILTFVIG